MLNNKHNTDYVIFMFYFCVEVKQLNIFIMNDYCIFEVEVIQSSHSFKNIFDIRTTFTINASDIKELHHILCEYAKTKEYHFDIISIKVIKHSSDRFMYDHLPF